MSYGKDIGITVPLLWAVLATWSVCGGAQIQPPAAPVYQASDENAVNFVSGSPYFSLWDVAIGSGESTLSHTLYSSGAYMGLGADSFRGQLVGSSNPVWINQNTAYPAYSIEWDGAAEQFYLSSGTFLNGTFVSLNGTGSTLVSNADGTHTYVRRDGAIMSLKAGSAECPTCRNYVTRVQYPDGRVLTMHYTSDDVLRSVTRNDGLQMKYNNTTGLTAVVAINNAYEYCDPIAVTCNLTQAWPTATYTRSTAASANSIVTVTDALGRVTRYTHDDSARVERIKSPTSPSTDNITYAYCNDSCFVISQNGSSVFPNMVMGVQRDGQIWQYSFLPGSGFSSSYYSSTNPQGVTTQAALVATSAPLTPFVGAISSVSGPNGGASWNILDPTGRVTGVTFATGQGQAPTYDARGNVTRMTYGPRSGTADAVRIVDAGYDVTCTNPITCNKANYVIDARGKRTDYQYDPVHGGLLSVTGPADGNGVRPQTRYAYAQRYAWLKNSSGSQVQAATPIWVRTQVKYCRTSNGVAGGGCTAAGDEVVVAYDYGPDSGPNNLFVRGVAITADGTTLRTCYGYDTRGNMISETAPRAGLTSCP